MNPTSSTAIEAEPPGPALCWPRLELQEDELASPPATPLARQVCEALERRLERLAAHPLPTEVAEDVMDMWRDLDAAHALLSGGAAPERPSRQAWRLLSDLQAWLPVCESWIGTAARPSSRPGWPTHGAAPATVNS